MVVGDALEPSAITGEQTLADEQMVYSHWIFWNNRTISHVPI